MRAPLLILFILFSLAAHGQVVAIENKLNILYACLNNPITVAVENTPPATLVLSTDNGIMWIDSTQGEGHYVIKPEHIGTATVCIRKHSKILNKVIFKVQKTGVIMLPTLAARGRGEIKLSDLRLMKAPYIYFEGFDFDPGVIIVSYKIIVLRNHKEILNKTLTDPEGALFDKETLSVLRNAEDKDEVIVKDINVLDDCKDIRHLDSYIALHVVDDKPDKR